MTSTTVLIIGAGPAGLATAGRLRHLGIAFEVIERSTQLVTSWQNHYDRLCLHTIKRFSGLPHMPLPDDLPEYVPRQDLVRYYQEYARTYSIAPHFGEEADQVTRVGDHWETQTKTGKRFQSKAVVVCTGFNRTPNLPSIPGLEDFSGTTQHSRTYKNAAPFQGKKVLVVGMGNSGAEIALDLIEQGVSTHLSVRGPVNIVPRDINGRPTQVTAKLIDRLPNWFGDWFARQIQKLVIGDLSTYGIHRPQISPRKQLRKLGKTPVLDIGTVARIKSGELEIQPGIEKIENAEVCFRNGKREAYDHIIFATGYHSAVTDFVDGAEDLLNVFGHPASPIAPETHRNLYFVGFDAYASGLLESIYRDSRRVVAHFLHNIHEEKEKV
jgi:cation diffusion facilitator CzcD-associated flavoprotein CzcO